MRDVTGTWMVIDEADGIMFTGNYEMALERFRHVQYQNEEIFQEYGVADEDLGPQTYLAKLHQSWDIVVEDDTTWKWALKQHVEGGEANGN